MKLNLHAETIKKIADSHIEMYGKRLRSNHRFVNVEETSKYLEIWKSIKLQCENALAAGQTSILLEGIELGEVVDAIDTGDYDDIMPKETTEQAM
jgi:hypothetical protein